ncbi:MAG: hypothetical protein IIZ25_00200 [Thermoguttaceae bacterium]|nr:hypothetical protein [Thermoguttaceae bacterium]
MKRKKQDARKSGCERRNGTFRSQDAWSNWEDPDEEYLDEEYPEEESVCECEYGTFSTRDRTVFYAESIDHSAELKQFIEIKINKEGIPYIEYYCILAHDDHMCHLVIPTQWEAFEPSNLSKIGIKTEWFEWFLVPDHPKSRITDRLHLSSCPGVPELKTKLESLGAKLYVPTPAVKAKILPGQKHVICNTSGGYKCEYGTFSTYDRTIFHASRIDHSAEIEYQFLQIKLTTDGIPYINYYCILAPDDYMYTCLIIPTQWEAFEPSYLSRYRFETQRFEWFRIPDHLISRIKDGLIPSSCPGVPELKTKLESLGAKLYVPTPAVKQKLSPGQKHVICDMSEGNPHFGEYGNFCE